MNNNKNNDKGMDGHQLPIHNYNGESESYANEDANAKQGLHCHVCFECKGKNMTPIPFHCCVKDVVTKGFQGPSPAGPIARREEQCVGTTSS